MSQATAGAVQNAVFGGADSGFAVVVRGVRADGSSATWDEYERSLDSVVRRAAEHGELEPIAQKPQLWRDFVDGGMTLLDAGNRSPELPPRTHGSQRAVLTTTSRVGVDPSNAFTLPANLAAFLPNWRIEAGDDIAVGRLFERLDHLSQTQPHLGQVISAERNRLREWAGRVRGSYSGHVGRRLGDAHRATIAEVQELTSLVERLGGQPQVPATLDSSQDDLAGHVRVMSAVAVSLLAIFSALTALSVIGWPFLILAVLLIIGGWAGTGAVLHMRSSARLYAQLNRLRAATTEYEDATRHRLEALDDLRRISRAYRQYLDWSRAFGAFIHAPLGRVNASTERMLHVGQGMPLNLAVGVAVPDDEAVEEVANRWRGELFRAGWLSEAWRSFETDLPASIGNLRHRLQQDPGLLGSDPVIDGIPVLTRWSTALAGRPHSVPCRRPSPGGSPNSPAVMPRPATCCSAGCWCATRPAPRARCRAPSSSRGSTARAAPPVRSSRASSTRRGVVDIRQVRHTTAQEDSTGLDVALVVVQQGGAFDASKFAGPQLPPEEPVHLQSSSDSFI
ncbi:hypothetical protein G7085_11670 [Tessaracoccus sp. HDW20]|uniref:hypothetical protein n=1 Tax=Tessaracoccus coleopterorum TaxID=2714950 RepID=UPI0018D34E5F|nr:hypothetical protein [Tessaracoccus coleopterorum]NHB85046.1 hypothetical protein [Tessaracoccus coleopterorum]